MPIAHSLLRFSPIALSSLSSHEFHTFEDGLLVEREQVVMAFGQRFPQRLHHVADRDDGMKFQESAKDEHVETLHHLQLGRSIHGVDAPSLNIGTRRRVGDAIAVIDERPAGAHLWFELFERWLVEEDGRVVAAEDRRRNGFVADNDGNVGRAATLFRAVGGHPRDLLALHQAGVGKDLSHREDALPAKAGYDYLFFHGRGDCGSYLSFKSPIG